MKIFTKTQAISVTKVYLPKEQILQLGSLKVDPLFQDYLPEDMLINHFKNYFRCKWICPAYYWRIQNDALNGNDENNEFLSFFKGLKISSSSGTDGGHYKFIELIF